MDRAGTTHETNDAVAMIYTKPKNTARVYRYPLHYRNGMWVLTREIDWYTTHVIDYVERQFGEDVLIRHLPPSQTSLDDYTGDSEEEPRTDHL
jgi:hypothetical protein